MIQEEETPRKEPRVFSVAAAEHLGPKPSRVLCAFLGGLAALCVMAVHSTFNYRFDLNDISGIPIVLGVVVGYSSGLWRSCDWEKRHMALSAYLLSCNSEYDEEARSE